MTLFGTPGNMTVMARKVRVQNPGAVYHVLSRGDAREFIGSASAKSGKIQNGKSENRPLYEQR